MESLVNRIYHVDRGYEKFEEKFKALEQIQKELKQEPKEKKWKRIIGVNPVTEALLNKEKKYRKLELYNGLKGETVQN